MKKSQKLSHDLCKVDQRRPVNGTQILENELRTVQMQIREVSSSKLLQSSDASWPDAEGSDAILWYEVVVTAVHALFSPFLTSGGTGNQCGLFLYIVTWHRPLEDHKSV